MRFEKKMDNNFSKMAIANLDIFDTRPSHEETKGKKSERTPWNAGENAPSYPWNSGVRCISLVGTIGLISNAKTITKQYR